MEFGARALGNRSILARADSPTAVREINEIVKNRDFWMPFGPSVLAERAHDYYEKPKPVSSPYMMFGFQSRPEKRASFAAALHPYDFTTRPQEVLEAHNADYYRLLKEYEARTGRRHSAQHVLQSARRSDCLPGAGRRECVPTERAPAHGFGQLVGRKDMRILVTGAAGFIGYHVAARLLRDGAQVLGIDNLNGYYDPRLKHARLALLEHARFEFARIDITDRAAMEALFEREEFSQVIHLAAQAGVRHSIDRPHDYIDSNITGFLNVLEGCRRAGLASSVRIFELRLRR